MAERRRDARNRLLRQGESIRKDGRYQFKYQVNGKPHFFYSWRLEDTDRLPVGKKPCLSLRAMEKQLGVDMATLSDPLGQNMTVLELVNRYLRTKTGVRPNTKMNYGFVCNLLKKESFAERKIRHIKRSDAKLFLIKLQEDGKGYSTIHSVRGVLRPAFQMAVDDEMLRSNPFSFPLVNVVVNDSVMRQALTPKQMRDFLKFVHDSGCYGKYYEVFYILFHTGMRISEFCGLTIRDLDMEKRIIDINHQLQRTSAMEYVIEKTKTNAGTRKIPMTDDVCRCFAAILEDRQAPAVEPIIGGRTGFLFYDKQGMPEVAMHWEHRFKHARQRYNEIYREQLPPVTPPVTPHICRHTYCSNMARAGMNPKTLQYLMGHSDISVTMNTYTHLGLEDAEAELRRVAESQAAREELEKLSGKEHSVIKFSREA